MPPTDLVMVTPSLFPNTSAARFEAGVALIADRTDSIPQTDNLERMLCDAIGSQSFQLWFRSKTALAIRGDELVVRVSSPFLATWLQRQFRDQINAVAANVLGPAARSCFEIDGSLNTAIARISAAEPSAISLRESQPSNSTQIANPTQVVATQRPAQPPTSRVVPDKSDVPHNPAAGRRFAKMSDFVIGGCNQLVATAAQQVCEAPGERLNPLYVFGGVGLGKSHVLEGIYCELRRRFPTSNVLFLTSEQFANYFTHALRSHSLPSFRQKFRGVDVLLVDDVDFLDGKRVIQEEFLHTVKSLESLGKQLIVSSDRHPRLLTQVSEELTTRFQAGLVCRLEAPDTETRARIVEHKLTQRPLEMAPEAIALVAQWFRNNVRELEGALNCLEAHYSLTRQRVTAANARQILADLQRDCVRIVRLADIERAICDLFRLIPDQLRSTSRSRSVAQPRMLAMFLARKLTQSAYTEIGEYFGGRNHSTVISAERQVQSWIFEDVKFNVATREWSAGELLQTLEQQLLAS